LPGEAPFRQRVVVCDSHDRGQVQSVMGRLPTDRRAQRGDQDVTFVVITRLRKTKVKEYGLNAFGPRLDTIEGLRVDVEVTVVDGPTRRAVAKATVTGNDPPETIRRQMMYGTVMDRTPEQGDWAGPLAEWAQRQRH
jgi:hypothetical protein